MKYVVDKGKTLLIDGPASVVLLYGDVSILGATLKIEERLVVRQGKRLPLFFKKTSTLEVMLGEEASISEIEEDSTPSSWTDASEELLSRDKPTTVLVVGKVDSGKTSFCTFLVNKAVNEKLKTGIIDADLSNSDLGPPSTVGFNFIAEPVKDLFEIHVRDAVFIGSTTPSSAINAISCLNYLKDKVMAEGIDVLVMNTDGWVESKEAVIYKVRLIEKIAPNIVVGMQHDRELTPILNGLHNVQVIFIDSPKLIQSKSRKKRKLLRELGYKKYMKGAKIHSFSLSWVKLEDSLLGSGSQLHHRRSETLCNLLGKRPIYSEETADSLLIVLHETETVNEKQIKAIEDCFSKRVKLIHEGDEKGLLVGLNDKDHFFGIGILHKVDYTRKVLKVYTPVIEKVSTLHFGQIKLNKNLRETGLSTVYSNTL
jgi:polynucleotide 5'-hydroxyl-kinase GRC3/NOL9